MRFVYVDSSIVVRRYLPGDAGHLAAVAVFETPGVAVVSCTLTLVEASGALVRAAKHLGLNASELLARLDEDVREGRPLLVDTDQKAVELRAVEIVRLYGIKALDSLHIASAELIRSEVLEPGDAFVFMSGDKSQAETAHAVGLQMP